MAKNLFLIGIFFLICVSAIKQNQVVTSDYTFEQYQKQFDRHYQGAQRQKHREAFNKNYQELLQAKKQSKGDYEVKVNNFTDMTDQERAKFFSYRPKQLKMPFDNLPPTNKLRSLALPNSLNYNALGKVTAVRDQKKCGSCWAFSTTAVYESQMLIKGQGQYDLAEQYVLQCTSGNSCDGGSPADAFNMFISKGLPLQSQFPYKASDSGYNSSKICSDKTLTKLTNKVNGIKHYNSVPDSTLKQLLVDYGPVSVGLKASLPTFMSYSGGTYTGCGSQTSDSQIDHVVLLVGWTPQGNWIIKNSWGTYWGNKGYAVIDTAQNCGITQFVDLLNVSDETPIPTPKPGPGPTPTPSPTPSGQSLNLKITMTDSYGDGWNGYILGIRQKNSIVTVFGENFKKGASQGPITIDIPSKIQTHIVVSVAGKYSKQIGFEITDDSKKSLCKRNPGTSFSNQIIFCTFCPDCIGSSMVNYYLTLTDAGNNGWNGNVLAFNQGGVITTFGEQFNGGSRYGPRKISFTKNIPVSVTVQKIGNKPEDIGYQIRDSFGNIVNKRISGSPFTIQTSLGQFCPGCVNLFSVSHSQEGSGIQQRSQIQNTIAATTSQTKVFVILVVILSLASAIMLGFIIYVFIKKRDYQLKAFKGDYPNSILVSTATIPDQLLDNSKAGQVKIN